MKEIWTNLLQTLGQAWWVEIITDAPRCTYYFGPFLTEAEAIEYQPGYIEDLQQEGAQNIQVQVKRCKPEQLTIEHEFSDVELSKAASPALTAQV
jgi:predicted HicB family RNase H-like nuclease